MMLSTLEIANARENARSLLEELGLEAYLFELEPGAAHWQLRVDCAGDGHWQSLLIDVDADTLAAAATGGAARQQLLAAWGERLRSCTGIGSGAR